MRSLVLSVALLATQAACGDYLQRTWEKASADEEAKEANDAKVLTADLIIDNNWADANFTVVEDTFGKTVVPTTRVTGFSSAHFAGVVTGHPDRGARLTVNTMAAQTAGAFRFDEPVTDGGTLHLAFDYDSVTLVFRMTASWE